MGRSMDSKRNGDRWIDWNNAIVFTYHDLGIYDNKRGRLNRHRLWALLPYCILSAVFLLCYIQL